MKITTLSECQLITIDLVDVEAWNYSWSKIKYVDIYLENFIEVHKHFHNIILC